jgi:PTH1 family peptidyl-tRNA hydrolase
VSTPLRLVAGLGNPGPEYSETRHNAGFWLVERLAAQHGTSFSAERRFPGQVTRLQSAAFDCRLLMPSTYMNRSGGPVQSCAVYYKVEPDALLVVHDEIDLPPGIARLKRGGGAGGHNGLTDVIERIGADFLRLRIGVGHPGNRDDVPDYVLHRPSREERTLIDEAIGRALAVMPMVMAGELERAMNELHGSE